MNEILSWDSLAGSLSVGTSIFLFCLAAIHTCYRAGSLHPLNNRLLRIFISRDDIQDELVKRNLSDYSALTVFRMTYRIPARTLKDAKTLIRRAEAANVPLELIGIAGDAFDIKSFRLVKKPPAGILAVIMGIFIFVFFWISMVLTIGAIQEKLLVSLKATGTHLWLGHNEAQIFRPFSNNSSVLSAVSCIASHNLPNAGDKLEGFSAAEVTILCDIWKDASTKAELEKSIREQKITFAFAAGFSIWICGMFFSGIRRFWALRQIRELLPTA